MHSVRDLIRTKIPLSTEIYERTVHARRRRTSKRMLATLLSFQTPLTLDLGGGYRPGRNGWINVDTSPQADFYWHLAEPLPFPRDSVDSIYSSHLLEHLTFEQTQRLLRECLRVLKPGAKISICVPNARLFIEHYLGLRELPEEFFAWESAFNDTTRIDAVNYVAYLGTEHRYMFDQENLLHILRKAGFHGVTERGFDPGVDLSERDHESIYAIGIKPRTNS